jgi:hypothetical protein
VSLGDLVKEIVEIKKILCSLDLLVLFYQGKSTLKNISLCLREPAKKDIQLPKGSILTFDMGYIDYKRYNRLTREVILRRYRQKSSLDPPDLFTSANLNRGLEIQF